MKIIKEFNHLKNLKDIFRIYDKIENETIFVIDKNKSILYSEIKNKNFIIPKEISECKDISEEQIKKELLFPLKKEKPKFNKEAGKISLFNFSKKSKEDKIKEKEFLKLETNMYHINHIYYDKNYYKVFSFRNYHNFNFNDILENNMYLYVKIEKTKEQKNHLLNNLKPNHFDFKEKEKILEKDYENEYSFNIYIFLTADTKENLEIFSSQLIEKFAEKQTEIKELTHINQGFFCKLFTKSKYKFMALENIEKDLEILTLNQYEINSSQNLFKISLLSNGLLSYNNTYFDIFEIPDINYYYSKETVKYDIFNTYSSMLNSLSSDIEFQILIENDLIIEKETEKDLFSVSNHRMTTEYNKYLENNLKVSIENSTIKKIYFIIYASKNKNYDYEKAFDVIQKNLSFIQRTLKQLKTNTIELNDEKKIRVLKNFIDYDYEGIRNKIKYDKERESICNYVSPTSFKFLSFDYHIGRGFASSFFIYDYPNKMTDSFIAEIMKLPFKLNISIRFEFEDLEKTVDKIGRKIFDMERDIIERKKKKTGYINYELKQNYEEALQLREELTKNDKKMFLTYISITLFDKTKKGLDEKHQIIESTIKKYMFRISKLFLQQENGFLSTLPLPFETSKKRALLSENVGMLMPFYNKNNYDKDGVFYGLSDDNNIISIDRRKYMNSSGWFLGVPGSGKSFLAKKEMLSVILRYPDDEVLIIDPEAEYGVLAKEFGGENVKISSSSSTCINPFDITENISELERTDEDNPLRVKQEFLITFIENLADGLSQSEKNIVDRVIRKIYEKYIENLKKEKLIKPTLVTLYNELLLQAEREAIEVALRLEIYVKGSLNIFSKETNVELDKRIVNFNIKDLGVQLKSVALLLICDFLWTKICKNRDLKKRTWIYIDEIYLLFGNEASAKFLFEFYKRVRKYGGVPTGITQNVEDLLKSDTARTMLSNAAFLCILRQSTNDRELLKDIFDLSDTQANFVKNNSPGTGIILSEGEVIHFSDKMDTKSPLYKMMSTKIDD